MLAALEDLLDSWPGTLIVVSHDRYFLERVTDQQYAVMDAHLRHLPGGVDEYLRLRASGVGSTSGKQPASGPVKAAPAASGLAGAELRAAQKELASVERRIAKLTDQVNASKMALAEHDHTDYTGLATKMAAIGELESEVEELELRWLDLSEALEG